MSGPHEVGRAQALEPSTERGAPIPAIEPAPAAPEPLRSDGIRRVHRFVKEIEPWGILIGVVALLVSLVAFWSDYSDRVEERTVRAWQLLLTRAPGNSGKREALEYLNKEDGLLCSYRGCSVTLKPRTPLVGLDLSGSDQGRASGAYLMNVQLPDADLTGANLSRANLIGANLSNAQLSGADLRGADLLAAHLSGANLSAANLTSANLSAANLSGADLIAANLFSADLGSANLIGANLSGANLRNVNLGSGNSSVRDRADLNGANLSSVDLSGAELTSAQLDGACGNDHTKLPKGLSIRSCPIPSWMSDRYPNQGSEVPRPAPWGQVAR